MQGYHKLTQKYKRNCRHLTRWMDHIGGVFIYGDDVMDTEEEHTYCRNCFRRSIMGYLFVILFLFFAAIAMSAGLRDIERGEK